MTFIVFSFSRNQFEAKCQLSRRSVHGSDLSPTMRGIANVRRPKGKLTSYREYSPEHLSHLSYRRCRRTVCCVLIRDITGRQTIPSFLIIQIHSIHAETTKVNSFWSCIIPTSDLKSSAPTTSRTGGTGSEDSTL